MCDREKSKDALATVLASQKNIGIFEKNIFDACTIKGVTDPNLYKSAILQVIQDILEGHPIKEILSSVKKGNVGIYHKCFDQIRMKREEQEEFLVTPFHVEEGVMECAKCKSKCVISYQVQERSCDEPASTYCTCTKCGTQWKYSG